ncbi:phage major capsid protein [Brevibacillus laterosporus]|uniref:phage major capsid protein n=1 Tax=Brevibacillus laterosporus TaxID=1465 RepID=UPI000CE430C7|nr:phage major capsid protein [Brevibacillus laterosporus]AYB39688.1 phage major capsid protein [Brevibacillus laterosporus]MBM7109111.1 Phage capsid family protein [Brevibacillus laterosporus]PPA82514.1 phage major capsid protein [Brevibacillus laterosporus]
MKTLFELKQNLVTIGQQLQKTESELATKAIDPSASIEDIQKLQQTKNDLKMRFDVVKEQHDSMEAEQKAKFEAGQGMKGITDPAQQKISAKAELIRATMRKQAVSADVLQVLGDNNTTGGNKFLPKTVSNDILVEPTVKNPLRNRSAVTQITNLEIPKLNFTLDDDDFIADTETAKELKATGDVVTFGRHKFKVFAGVSETVLNGTDANLVSYVENALQSGVAAKEKKVAFAVKPKAGEEHMSFYGAEIKEVTAETKYKAIKAAIADLHEDYRENAVIYMRFQDYSDIIEVLANGNATLYTAQPEQVLGKPVEFCDSAVDPVVGDFNYSHFNYDLNALYDRDKDVKTGVELFVLTAWIDHQIKLKSAFRIAKVVATP